MDDKKAKNTFGAVFGIISAIFLIIGIVILLTNKSPEDYTKNGEYTFTFNNISKETKTTSRSRSRTTGTKTTYIPIYSGYVDEQPYSYRYHTVFSSSAQANSFVYKNSSLLVYTYIDDENNIFYLASDITLEEYLKRQTTLGYIFVCVALFLLALDFVILKFYKISEIDNQQESPDITWVYFNLLF